MNRTATIRTARFSIAQAAARASALGLSLVVTLGVVGSLGLLADSQAAHPVTTEQQLLARTTAGAAQGS